MAKIGEPHDECEYCEERVENGLIYDGLSFDSLNCVISWVLREHKKIWVKEKESLHKVELTLTKDEIEKVRKLGIGIK